VGWGGGGCALVQAPDTPSTHGRRTSGADQLRRGSRIAFTDPPDLDSKEMSAQEEQVEMAARAADQARDSGL
jgi:hypothetical protein